MRSANVGTVLESVRVSVVPLLVAVIFWLMADWPPIFRSMLWAVACEVAAAAKAGATARAETVTAPMIAPERSRRRFKMIPPGWAPLPRHRAMTMRPHAGPQVLFRTL